MSISSLNRIIVLDDRSADALLEMENEDNPPFLNPSYVSRLATPERMAEIEAMLLRGKKKK